MIGLLRWVVLFCGLGLLALDAHAVKPMVAAGVSHTLVLRTDGSLVAMGSDYSGQLGVGRISSTSTPIQAKGIGLVHAIAAGTYHVVSLKQDGTVWAWGNNAYGQLGDGTNINRSVPFQVKGLSNVTAIAAGADHTIALKQDGSVWGWGSNEFSQIGNGTTTNCTAPVQVKGLTGVIAIAAGYYHTIALRQDGTVWTWGANGNGQLGDGTGTNSAIPIQVTGLGVVIAIAAGAGHTVAVAQDGTVWAWGDNLYGQLGVSNDDNIGYTYPVQVTGLSGITAISAGTTHTVAMKQDGTVWTWGDNRDGQLGFANVDGFNAYAYPVEVTGLNGVTAIATKSSHTVALKQDGSVWAWGNNIFGQLGDNTTSTRTTPVQVTGMSEVAIAAGADNTIALNRDGTVWVWGGNKYGQLSDGTTESVTYPIQIMGLTDVAGIAVGDNLENGKHGTSYSLKQDGTVWSWGDNRDGQLGDGTTTKRSTPFLIKGLSGVARIAAGTSTGLHGNHAVAVKQDGTVWSWGNNNFGQLGDGTTTKRSTPVQVNGLNEVTGIGAGTDFTVAVNKSGTVVAWGRNFEGQLGDGTTTSRFTPVQVMGLNDVTAVAAGMEHAVALKRDGTVWAWGRGSGIPDQVKNLSNVIAIAASGSVTVMLKRDGTVWVWKNNNTEPVQLSDLSGIIAITAGFGYTVAIREDGTVWAQGKNSDGQLGDGTYDSRSTYGGVVNDTFSGFFDLDPTVPNLPIPADKIPPFFLAASKSGDLSSLSLSARVRLAPVDSSGNVLAQANRFAAGCGSGGTCQIFVAAYAPAGARTPPCVQASVSATDSWWAADTPRNWNIVGSTLPAFLSNVTPGKDKMVEVEILSNCNLLTDRKGTVFYLGWGENADEMLKAGRYREILPVPDK